MAQARIYYYENNAITKTFIIEGLLSMQVRKSQSSIEIPCPGTADDKAVINSIFGQKMIFNCAFIILTRSDDYTNGTGTPSNYSPDEQRTFLIENIFQPGGFHVLQDCNGHLYSGRIEDIQINEAGDDPVKFDCVFSFKRGLVPFGDNLTPIE
jgi:hypothetical protein